MVLNIAIFVMSPYGPRETTYIYRTGNDDFLVTCRLSNEPALCCISHECGEIDHFFALVSGKVGKEYDKILNDFEQLDELKSVSQKITQVELDGGTLQGALKSISDLFDHIMKYIRMHPEDTICVHLDVTGGFRHASMMMLPLIQLLRYNGIQVGKVLYSNFFVKPAIVEDAIELLDMFSLVGGADNFVSFGDVTRLQSYFAGKKMVSNPLKQWLDAMDSLSDTIRICVSYSAMNQVLIHLDYALIQYKDFVASMEKKLGQQELFFSKMITKIEEEYSSILPHGNRSVSPVAIITWCVQKGFLQQAITFYTEWLPQYLVKDHFIDFIDSKIKKACQSQERGYSSWENVLFRTYMPPNGIDLDDYQPVSLQACTNNAYKKGWSSQHFFKTISGKSDRFESFVKRARDLASFVDESKMVDTIFTLPKKDLVRLVVVKSIPKGVDRRDFLAKRLSKTKTADWMIIESVIRLSKKDFNEIFCISEEKNEIIAGKSNTREKVFETLLNQKKISITMDRKSFLRFIFLYSQNVMMIRNRFNHADNDFMGEEADQRISQQLIESLQLLQKK